MCVTCGVHARSLTHKGGSVQASRLVATAPSELDSLKMRIASRTAKVGLIGLGYAGLPLAVAFAEAAPLEPLEDLHRFVYSEPAR